MPWLMPHLAAEALLEVEQGASNAQELPMVKREAGAPSNDAGPSQVITWRVSKINVEDNWQCIKPYMLREQCPFQEGPMPPCHDLLT